MDGAGSQLHQTIGPGLLLKWASLRPQIKSYVLYREYSKNKTTKSSCVEMPCHPNLPRSPLPRPPLPSLPPPPPLWVQFKAQPGSYPTFSRGFTNRENEREREGEKEQERRRGRERESERERNRRREIARGRERERRRRRERESERERERKRVRAREERERERERERRRGEERVEGGQEMPSRSQESE